MRIAVQVVLIVGLVAVNVALWRVRRSVERTAAKAQAMSDQLDVAIARAATRAVESWRR